MSIHSSLKTSGSMKRHRSVLSRLERIKLLHDRGDLDLEVSSVLGLPKVKHLRIKIKKEKAAAPAAGEAGAAPAAGEAGAAAAGKPAGSGAAKPAGKAAPAKEAAPAEKGKPEAGGAAKKKA